jgi:hypothetical protein
MVKKIIKYLIITSMFFLIGCTNKPEKELIGSWVTFDNYYGIVEIEFKKDYTMVTKYYVDWEKYEYESNGYYAIIDGNLFITNKNEGYEGYDKAYNYFITKNRLVLSSGDYGNIIYNRIKKTNKTISNPKKLLIGQWRFPEYKSNIRLIFSGNTVIIRKYDDELNILKEEVFSYETTERYIKIKNIDGDDNNEIIILDRYYIHDGAFLYKIDKNTLILKHYNPEVGLRASMFLLKVTDK